VTAVATVAAVAAAATAAATAFLGDGEALVAACFFCFFDDP